MEKDNKNVCQCCGTPFVPANQTLKNDGSLKMDGSFNLDNMVCPKCHPDLAESK